MHRDTHTHTHTHMLAPFNSSHAPYAVGAAPFALWGFLHLRVQADKVVGPRAGVTENDLPTLLAHLAVILVVCLVSVTFFDWKTDKKAKLAKQPLPRCWKITDTRASPFITSGEEQGGSFMEKLNAKDMS